MQLEITWNGIAIACTILGVSGISVFAVLGRMYRATLGKPNQGQNKYIGHYESYHVHSTIPDQIVKSHFWIKKGKYGRLIGFFNSFGYQYKCELTFLSNNIFLSFTGETHREKMLFVLHDPLYPHFDYLVGVYSAMSETLNPLAGKIFFQKVHQAVAPEKILRENCNKKIVEFLESDLTSPIVVERPDVPLISKFMQEKNIVPSAKS